MTLDTHTNHLHNVMTEYYNETEKEPIVAIVGNGNVACHLCRAFEGKAEVHEVNSRTFEGMPSFADIVIIAVKDSAIEKVAQNLPGNYNIVAHTSGSVPVSVLESCGHHYGVFYPLQTFSKDAALDYSEIPFFIEGDCKESYDALTRLALSVSASVYGADSEKRKTLHLASVFACNFSNCLIGIADDILSRHDIDRHVLLPLLRQTVAKLDYMSPREAQTGPASRRDTPVMESHREMLIGMGKRDLAELYAKLSEQIIH